MTNSDTNETAALLRRSVTRMNRRLRQSALGGISPAQASMLASVEKLGNPSLGELATREQIQPPSVTRVVRHLEEVGLIELHADETDRRCTRARLTDSGRLEVSAIRQRKTEFLEAKLRALSPDEQGRARELAEFLEHLLDES